MYVLQCCIIDTGMQLCPPRAFHLVPPGKLGQWSAHLAWPLMKGYEAVDEERSRRMAP